MVRKNKSRRSEFLINISNHSDSKLIIIEENINQEFNNIIVKIDQRLNFEYTQKTYSPDYSERGFPHVNWPNLIRKNMAQR